MASEDKKTETSPAPKKEVPRRTRALLVRLRAPQHLLHRPPPIAGARARSRFLKPTGITGTSFSRRKKSDNFRLSSPVAHFEILAQTIGLGLALRSAMKLWTASLRSWIERNTPRLRRRLVTMAKMTSTALSEEAEVGVEEDEAPMAAEPFQDLEMFVRGVVVDDDVDDLFSVAPSRRSGSGSGRRRDHTASVRSIFGPRDDPTVIGHGLLAGNVSDM
jgi:hypothetical protein